MTLENAYQNCLEIARNHYENFPVASWLVPKSYRKHIAAVYAFARIADDFADEEKNKTKILNWRRQLYNCLSVEPKHPIFYALADTIQKFNIPVNWFDNLLTAFLWDVEKNRFQDFSELLEYSKYSANPVGRIILHIFGYSSENLMLYSDSITTALQLTNFWQDISVDIKRDKIYLPLGMMEKFKVNEQQIENQKYSPGFEQLIDWLIDQTKSLYNNGFPLLYSVKGRLRWELKFTLAGGEQVLEKIANNKINLLYYRPILNKRDWLRIFFKFFKPTLRLR